MMESELVEAAHAEALADACDWECDRFERALDVGLGGSVAEIERTFTVARLVRTQAWRAATALHEIDPNHRACLRFNALGERLKDETPRWRQARWVALSDGEREAETRSYQRQVAQVARLRRDIFRADAMLRKSRLQVCSRVARSPRASLSGRVRSSRRVVRQASRSRSSSGKPGSSSSGGPGAADGASHRVTRQAVVS